MQYFKPRKRDGRNAASPYPEKHREKPLRDKKDCRTKKRTAEEKESLLAGRGGNSNGTKKATGEKKRTAEKRESRQVGGRAVMAAKRVQKAEETRFPTVKKNKTALSGTCRSGKVLLSLCRFTETVPIWPKHSIYS
ncbi:MAG: hypothetical protein ACLU5I_10360 [Alistipes finegoldii]